jgi:hypothetical protein
MFVTSNYICFYSRILNRETILILKMRQINSISKTMHAVIFPTAIRIQTQNSAYSFTSFRSRSQTLDHLNKLLKQSRLLHETATAALEEGNEAEMSVIKSPLSMPLDMNNNNNNTASGCNENEKTDLTLNSSIELNINHKDDSVDMDDTTNNQDTSINEEDEEEEEEEAGSNVKHKQVSKNAYLATGRNGKQFTYYNDSTTTNPNMI